MRRQTQWARAAAVLVVMAASATALSQPAPAGAGAPAPAAADPTVAAVKRHYSAGRNAADAKQWPKAVEEFEKAYALKPLPQLAGNLGEAELRVGRFRDAAEHVERFLREDKGADADDKKNAQAWLDEAKKKIVTLRITVDEVGAEVLVDDKVIGTSPLAPEVYVEPGKHTVVARKGTMRVEVTDTYEAGWTRVMRLVPQEPGAGQAAAPTATAAPTVSSGGGDTSGPRKGLVIGGAALGGGLWLAGAILAGVSASKAGRAGELGGWDQCYDSSTSGVIEACVKLHALHNESALLGNLSAGMFYGGALVGGATLLYALRILPPGGHQKAALSATPVIASSAGGILVTGSF